MIAFHGSSPDDEPNCRGRFFPELRALRMTLTVLGGDRIPSPSKLAGAGIEAADRAARGVDAGVVADRRADHDDVGDDHRRGRHLVLALPAEVADAGLQIDQSALAEIGARLAAVGVERDEPGIVGGREDTPPACPIEGHRRVEPRRHATTNELIRREHPGYVQIGVEAPALLAALRVEREHPIEHAAPVHRAVDEDRGHLVGGGRANLPATVGDVSAVVLPGDLEKADVFGRDLGERRKALAPGIVAPFGPLGDRPGEVQRRGSLRPPVPGGGEEGDSCDGCRQPFFLCQHDRASSRAGWHRASGSTRWIDNSGTVLRGSWS